MRPHLKALLAPEPREPLDQLKRMLRLLRRLEHEQPQMREPGQRGVDGGEACAAFGKEPLHRYLGAQAKDHVLGPCLCSWFPVPVEDAWVPGRDVELDVHEIRVVCAVVRAQGYPDDP